MREIMIFVITTTMKILVALHLIFLLAPNDASPTLSPNGPVYITYGGSLALTCETNQDAAVVRWKRNNVTIIIVTNTTVCSFVKFNIWDTYNYSMTCDRQRMFMIVRYRVNSSDDNSTWSCQMSSPNNTDLGTSTPVRVLMHIPVGSAQLLNGTTLTLTENQSAVLVCETDACRPSAAIYWMKDGRNITNSTTSVTAINVGSDLFVSIGTLTYTGQRGDNRKILTCGAYNDFASTQTSRNLTVIIYYPPEDPPVIDGRANGSNLTVIENISQILTCRIIGGNPLANLSWICLDHIGLLGTSGETVTSMIVLSVNRSAQDRRCTCRSSHQVDGNKDIFVSLRVHYHPSIEGLINTYNVIEYESLNVKCQVNSNPPPDQISWSPIGDSSVPSTLYLSSVLRNQSGTYICRAHNMMVSTDGTQLNGTTTSQIQVDVLYPPLIEGLTSPYKVIENQPLNVTCKASSNPPPYSISWSPNGEGSVPSWLYFSSLSRNKSGNYSCTAQNSMIQTDGMRRNGTITSRIQVDVLYGAKIVNLSVQDGNIVNENSSVIFKCHVDSNPLSTMTWMKESSNTVLHTESGVLQSQYRIESAECLNMGNYTCSAYNGIWTTAKERLELFVRCHPRTDYRLNISTKIYKRRYEAAVLNYTVISYPLPKFNWTFLGNGSVSIDLPTSASQRDDGYQSELSFTSLGIDDFGNYSVIADNSLPPSARVVFEIIPAGPPYMVLKFYLNRVGDQIELHFDPGFNGGCIQVFVIQYKSETDLEDWKNASILPETETQYRLPNGTFTVNITKPFPGSYIYRMYSWNEIDRSPYSYEIKVFIPEVITPDSSSTFSLPAVAGGIGAGVVVILMAVVALFLWRRYHHRCQHTEGTKRNQINAKSVRHDAASGQDYEGLHINNAETSPNLQLNDITLEENRYANRRPPENDSYEKLHPYTNTDIQMYSSLKIPKISKDSEKVYENTQIKATNFNC